MKRPVVLLDVDGVLANFVEATLRVLRVSGHAYQHDDVTAYDFANLALTPSDRAMMKRQWAEPGFCAAIPPYAGAREGVNLLREVADVYAVTAPMWSSITWQGERMEWLVGHFDFDRRHIVSTAAKHLVRGDVLVEDKPETLVSWSAAGGPAGLLWEQPYNATSTWRYCVSDWRDVASVAVRCAEAA